MMSWWDIKEAARAELDMITPTMKNDARLDLFWMSSAQHEYQSYSNIILRSLDVALDPTSMTGIYPLPIDIKLLLAAEVRQGPSTRFEVLPAPWDTFERIVRESSGNPIQPNTLFSRNSRIYVTIKDRQLMTLPVAMTGNLHITYRPPMEPFSITTPSGDWSAYAGANLVPSMKANGPEREFTTVINGIKAYLKAMIVQSHPGAMKTWGPVYQMSLAEFEKFKPLLLRDATQSSKRVYTLPRNSPIR